MLNKKSHIPGIVIIKPKLHFDNRGIFFEVFNKKVYSKITIKQINVSVSKKNVLRGLHFQKHPHLQGKFIWVSEGSILDVVVDLRKNSKFFGKHMSVTLKKNQGIWIPPGFAHGFYTKEKLNIINYAVTKFYNPKSEVTIKWNDNDLKINWGTDKKPIISSKDAMGLSFKNLL